MVCLDLMSPEQLDFDFTASRLLETERDAQPMPVISAPDALPAAAPVIVPKVSAPDIVLTPDVTPVPGAASVFSLLPQIGADGRPAPIPYELKVSAKARQVYLRVEPGRGLQVTIPKRYAKRSIPALVESQREWITEALTDLDQKIPDIYRQWPPPQIYLTACDTTVNISYTASTKADSGTVNWVSPTELTLSVDTHNKPLVAKCIASALKPFAKELLGPWLARCAEQSQLHYKRMVVRGQKTVWGSYSSSGTLSLNYKLLFVRPELVEYVLLHELAHTRYLDHSPTFWRFLDQLKPNAAEFDKELKEAGSLAPPWLELAG